MKLIKVRIKEFQSIQDSNDFDIGDVTCLVGKNEAGKTALLKALYRLNPIRPTEGHFDLTDDYPSQDLGDYENQVEDGQRKPADVVEATYELEENDFVAIEKVFGPNCTKDDTPTVTLYKGYSNEIRYSGLHIDEVKAITQLIISADLSQSLTNELLKHKTANEMVDVLANELDQTENLVTLSDVLQEISGREVADYICQNILFERIPKFLYFDEYYQMKGQDNLEALRNRFESDELEDADHPLLGLIELAGLDLDQLANPTRTLWLRKRLESAGNRLTKTVLTYWSQNQHLQMEFGLHPALANDPPGMTDGMNLWGFIRDTKHNVSTPLGTRSRGFLWFFSFLAWYSHLRKNGENLILLLDEPGLSLHAKAQSDLLNYFEQELIPHHQLAYTTHSPFMVDPTHFDRVRIVQDLSIELDSDDLPEDQQGTRVTTDVLAATSDSLFPLQSALGYEISQTLFVGPNSLVVEGVSDLLYIQTMSALLHESEMIGLSEDWTITPVGGSGNVSKFVALIGAQANLNVAVLIDYQKKDMQKIEHLFKSKLLERKKVLTYAKFVSGDEAETETDIEDMFAPRFYLKLVENEFDAPISLDKLNDKNPRIIRKLEKYLMKNPFPKGAAFSHYRPARYFSENIGSLKDDLDEEVLARFEKAFKALNALL